jgi:hypothetical protein
MNSSQEKWERTKDYYKYFVLFYISKERGDRRVESDICTAGKKDI